MKLLNIGVFVCLLATIHCQNGQEGGDSSYCEDAGGYCAHDYYCEPQEVITAAGESCGGYDVCCPKTLCDGANMSCKPQCSSDEYKPKGRFCEGENYCCKSNIEK